MANFVIWVLEFVISVSMDMNNKYWEHDKIFSILCSLLGICYPLTFWRE